MSTGQYSYALDLTGAQPANKITGETHTISPINGRNYHFIIPTFAPFFANSMKLFQVVGVNQIPMTEGVDWHPALQFSGATLATAKPIYGAVSFTNLQFAGDIVIEYQTLGGEYTLDVPTMVQVIADIVYNPRGATWEQVTNLQTMFPPINHPWDFNDMVGQTELIQQLGRIEDAIIGNVGTGLEDHIRNLLNPHRVSKNQVELGLVENFGPATSLQAIAGASNTTLITPMTLKAALEAYGLLDLSELIALIRGHVYSEENPHKTDKHQVILGQVENLPVASHSDILGKRKVRKYLTLEGLIDYLALYGCSPNDEEPDYPPKDALLSTYCSNVNKLGVYATGSGGTYEKIIEINSRDCGYVPPPPMPTHPQQGTLLNKYCVGYDQHATYADGYGGSFTRMIGFNSPECGFVGGTPPPSGCTAAGTILSTRCEGTTLVKVIANGSCGSYEERVVGSDQCEDETQCPPAGQLVSTQCVGFNLSGQYTNGSCGFYTAIVEMRSLDCGYVAPTVTFTTTPTPTYTVTNTWTNSTPTFTTTPGDVRPALSISIANGGLSVGQRTTLTTNITSLMTGKSYTVVWYRKHFNQGTFSQYYNSATFTATGSTNQLTFNIDNNGDVTQGSSEFKAEIVLNSNQVMRDTSNIAQLQYYANKGITLTMNNSSSSITATVYDEVATRIDFRDFPITGISPINPSISYSAEITGAENRTVGPRTINTNSSGGAYFEFSNTTLQSPNIRGQINYRIVATWNELGGGTQTTYSNYVAINWVL